MKCAKITFAVKENSENYNGTRLSARADVILTLKEGYDEIKRALLDIAAVGKEELLAKAETKCSSKKVWEI
jgi:hypothetical protein